MNGAHDPFVCASFCSYQSQGLFSQADLDIIAISWQGEDLPSAWCEWMQMPVPHGHMVSSDKLLYFVEIITDCHSYHQQTGIQETSP